MNDHKFAEVYQIRQKFVLKILVDEKTDHPVWQENCAVFCV